MIGVQHDLFLSSKRVCLSITEPAQRRLHGVTNFFSRLPMTQINRSLIENLFELDRNEANKRSGHRGKGALSKHLR